MKISALSINAKLAILIVSFICIPFLTSGVFWYIKATAIIESNVINYNMQNIEQINDRLNFYFHELERRTISVINNSVVNEFLDMPAPTAYQKYVIKQRLDKEVLLNFISERPDIYSFTIASVNGLIASSYSEDFAMKGYEMYMSSQYVEEKYVDKHFRIMGIRWENNLPVLTVIRRIIDTYSYKTKGILIIDLNYRTIYEILEKVKLGHTGYLMVVNSEGIIIYHPEQEKWGQQAVMLPLEDFKGKETGYLIDTRNNIKEIIIYNHSHKTDWTLIVKAPLKELIGRLNDLLYLTIIIVLVLIGAALAIISIFTVSITHPLLVLQQLMKKAEQGYLDIRAPAHKSREISSLYKSFNKMVTEIKRLMEAVNISELREKEMEIKQMQSDLQIMQSQINPHFLYNTLEVVNSYAIEAEAEPISHMIALLAKMFRYNAGNQKKIVTLKEEIDYIKIYLQFQKERFKDLEVNLQTDNAITEQVKTVRLILQPIVENAFTHGYEGHEIKPEYIGISGRITHGRYILTVKDKGKGMKPHTMEKFNSLFTGITTKQMIHESHYVQEKTLGLWNVHSRLHLTFGESYGLFIRKSDIKGTEIEMILPI